MRKVGIIGYGNMGSAIAERLNVPLCLFDVDTLKTANLRDTVTVVLKAALVVQNCDVIILAVKPQDFDSLLDSIKKPAEGKNKLFISIAAGITTTVIEKVLGKAHVIRTMPNMPAQIGEGITALSKGAFATEEDLEIAEDIFACVGMTLIVPESMMNAVTAISGSGPAFFCYYIKDIADAASKKDEFIKELTQAAISIGFDNIQAARLSEKTVFGTIALLKGKNWQCAELIKKVASKGGTTEVGLRVLKEGGSLSDAVKAALKRAKELSVNR